MKIISENLNRITNKNIRQIISFLICGGTAALTDISTYYLYLNFTTYSPAKALSFITGAIVAYFANKYFTFEQKEKSTTEMLRFAILYFITFFVNVFSNKALLLVTGEQKFASLIGATIITMCCNFIGQKFFVFRK